MDALIETRGLVMDYDERTRALDGLDLTVGEGEWVSIMGPSGSGKTTLLNILGCLDTPTSGNVKIAGKEVTGLGGKQLTEFRRENIGFIFQQFHLVSYLTALENVMLSQYFVEGRGIELEAAEALERVGMGRRLDHLPSQLSGGEQQRVAVARALVNQPRILLADEPTGNLDQANGQKILELLESLHGDGHTIVLITHDRKVGELGQRIITIIDGKVVPDDN